LSLENFSFYAPKHNEVTTTYQKLNS